MRFFLAARTTRFSLRSNLVLRARNNPQVYTEICDTEISRKETEAPGAQTGPLVSRKTPRHQFDGATLAHIQAPRKRTGCRRSCPRKKVFSLQVWIESITIILMDEEEIDRVLQEADLYEEGMSLAEKRDLYTAVSESRQEDSDVIALERNAALNRNLNEEEQIKRAIEESLSESRQSQGINFHDRLGNVRFDFSKCRRPATEEEIARRMSFESVDALRKMWKDMVSGLKLFENSERTRYVHQIQEACNEIGPEPSSGMLISVILPQGNRITRKWNPDAACSGLYLWCAASEKMTSSLQRIGSFVIVKVDGEAINPNRTIGEMIQESPILLNIWLL